MGKSLLVSALLAFFSTTMDDFAVMLIFFGRVHTEMAEQDIRSGYLKVIVGQTIGFSIVVFISLIGLLVGALIPEEYVDLVGLFPLIVGLMKAHEVMAEDGVYTCTCFNKQSEDYDKLPQSADASDEKGDKPLPVSDVEVANSFQKSPDRAGAKESADEKGEGDDKEEESNILSNMFKRVCQSCMDPFVVEVAAYALVCSSDNIAIYISIFAPMKLWEVLFVTLLFYLCLGFNIAIAMCLMRCRAVSVCLEDYSKYLVPFLLIGLGIYILSDSIIWPF